MQKGDFFSPLASSHFPPSLQSCIIRGKELDTGPRCQNGGSCINLFHGWVSYDHVKDYNDSIHSGPQSHQYYYCTTMFLNQFQFPSINGVEALFAWIESIWHVPALGTFPEFLPTLFEFLKTVKKWLQKWCDCEVAAMYYRYNRKARLTRTIKLNGAENHCEVKGETGRKPIHQRLKKFAQGIEDGIIEPTFFLTKRWHISQVPRSPAMYHHR